MSPTTMVLLEGGLVFGGALAWLVYEWYSLRRDRERDDSRK